LPFHPTQADQRRPSIRHASDALVSSASFIRYSNYRRSRRRVPIDIDRLTEAELIDLNRRIVERLKFLSQMRAHAQMLDFSIGDRVCFDADPFRTVSGVIVKYNRKTVTIMTADGQPWRVSPSLLRHESPTKRTEPTGRRLVELNGPED
jgi:hypothetical protein